MPSSEVGGGRGSEVSGGHAVVGWEAFFKFFVNEKVILEQIPKGSGQLGMACVWERHVLGREQPVPMPQGGSMFGMSMAREPGSVPVPGVR